MTLLVNINLFLFMYINIVLCFINDKYYYV